MLQLILIYARIFLPVSESGRKRMGKKGKKLKIFSALEVANLCGVVNQTAINWIKNGYLKAFTTPWRAIQGLCRKPY